MSKYVDAVCRLCRREDMKLFLKGDRCYTSKCAFERRAYPPGQHGQTRRKRSDYRDQLREKQKVRRIYGLAERQFRGYYYRATRMRGITGENLLQLLERRLDNVVYRLGFAASRNEARQLVRHRHFCVNGRVVNIPSFSVRVGDEIEVKERSRPMVRIGDALGAIERRPVPAWLDLHKDLWKGLVKGNPAREGITLPIREQLIVELYSK